MRVAVYCRVGNPGQLSEETIQRQSDMLNALAKEQQHTVVCSALDYGSGLDFKRDGLKKINSAVEAGFIDAVLVQDISRIGRDFFKTNEYLEYLRKHNVRVLQADRLNGYL